jgi:hypothetical protein
MGSVTNNSPSNGSPTATNASNAKPQPPSPAGLIPEPKEKLNANPDAVYELLGIKWNDRKKMQVCLPSRILFKFGHVSIGESSSRIWKARTVALTNHDLGGLLDAGA